MSEWADGFSGLASVEDLGRKLLPKAGDLGKMEVATAVAMRFGDDAKVGSHGLQGHKCLGVGSDGSQAVQGVLKLGLGCGRDCPTR
jgi:hypothetical protein